MFKKFLTIAPSMQNKKEKKGKSGKFLQEKIRKGKKAREFEL